MFCRLVGRSLRGQRARLGIATVAVFLGATLVSAMVNLSFDVGSQSGRELRAYGANILLVPRAAGLGLGNLEDGNGISERTLAELDAIPGVTGFTPFLYVTAQVQRARLVAAGVAFERLRALQPWWQVTGRWPSGPDDALVGIDAAKALGLQPGERFAIGTLGAGHELVVAGLVEAGGAEDGQIFVPLAVAQALSGRPQQVGLVRVSALGTGPTLARVTSEIEARLPSARARTLGQFAQAEETVLAKVRLLMGLVAGTVLGLAALAVGSTVATAVLERRAEMGLMKALGAAPAQVGALFLAEGLSIGMLGGLGGYAAGLGLAALIGEQVFRARLDPSVLSLPATLAVAVGVALGATVLPVCRAVGADPAATLRGE